MLLMPGWEYFFYMCVMCVHVCVRAGVGEVMTGALRTRSSNGSRVCKIEAFGY